MPNGDVDSLLRLPAAAQTEGNKDAVGAGKMQVGDRVRVWNGGESWPGRIHSLPGNGQVVVVGTTLWLGFRAIVPRSRMARSTALECEYDCRLCVTVQQHDVGEAAGRQAANVTTLGVTFSTPDGETLPLSSTPGLMASQPGRASGSNPSF